MDAATPRYATIAGIKIAVAATWRMPLAEMRGRRQGRGPARMRMVAMWLASRLTPCSLPEIGRHFDRDHTTVINAVQRVPVLVAADPDFADLVRAAEALCIAESSPDA